MWELWLGLVQVTTIWQYISSYHYLHQLLKTSKIINYLISFSSNSVYYLKQSQNKIKCKYFLCDRSYDKKLLRITGNSGLVWKHVPSPTNGRNHEKLWTGESGVFDIFVLPDKQICKIAVIYICAYLLLPTPSKYLVIFSNEGYFSWRAYKY
jgi:hypothetical protein